MKTAEPEEDCIYPVGVDPYWYMGKNELTYMNSLKMKLSVILGVAQMSLGIFMKAFNSVHFKRGVDFWFEFIPQIVLLLALFGFMDLLIIVKWLTDFS
jgi:V-type H+-transporting ATPase subunit a